MLARIAGTILIPVALSLLLQVSLISCGAGGSGPGDDDKNDGKNGENEPPAPETVARLEPDDASQRNFGSAVAASGDTVVIGGVTKKAYVFRHGDAGWQKEAILEATDTTADLRFGQSVAIFDDTILVGSPLDEEEPDTDGGAAYVYRRTGTTWAAEAMLRWSVTGRYDHFGKSVALGDGVALVAAEQAVYLFTRTGPEWTAKQKITRDGINQHAALVALDGSSAAVSWSDDPALSDFKQTGYVQVFDIANEAATLVDEFETSVQGDGFGLHSVSIVGDRIAVNASLGFSGNPSYEGGVIFLYARTGGAWAKTADVTLSQYRGLDKLSQLVGNNLIACGDKIDATTPTKTVPRLIQWPIDASGQFGTPQFIDPSIADASSSVFCRSLSATTDYAVVGITEDSSEAALVLPATLWGD